MKVLKFIAWLCIPYIMILISWKKLKKPVRFIAVAWAIFALIATIAQGKSDPNTTSAANNHKKSQQSSVAKAAAPAKKDTTKKDKSNTKSDSSKPIQSTTAPSKDFQPAYHPEIASASRNGGLGDTFDQLKKVFGEPSRTNEEMSGGTGQYNYQDDYQVVNYTEGRVSNITYQLDTKNNTMTEQKAKDFALGMIPADSTFVRQYDEDTNMLVLVYHSKSLESLFDPQQFQDANGDVHLGQFDIVLTHDGNQVGSMGAMLGDNP